MTLSKSEWEDVKKRSAQDGHPAIMPTVQYKSLVEQLYNRRKTERALSCILAPNALDTALLLVEGEQRRAVVKRFILLAKCKGLINHDRVLNGYR